MSNIIIDSDILLDFFLQRKPFLDESIKILSACEKRQVKGFVTGLIISNTYYILRKHFQHKTIMADFKQLLVFLDVITIDKNTIIKAIDSEFTDFEDALQNFSAENHGSINAIVTRNIKDYKKSNLSVLTPIMFLKTL
ncbi:type II toxin-antitoxin system VapC family toxin [Pedobacter roseus]|jgi:predicted nucleic acid-binding protein|uniref:PIN domain-containing protein n=1 Tax=Pedobacter roseus TaxID=336820 RepID=A0A7G9QBX5_9SPHI|nr:PIN domain-containing protein [Pedobacter roseus]QNN40850.1 PIN domain-containing protein [Pedobacter roseus]